MSKAITLKSPEMVKFAKFMKSHPDLMLKNARVAVKKSLLMLERDSKKFAPVSEGTLRKSIKTVLKPMVGSVVATAKHAVSVHEGTKPHWPSYEPNSSLERWARQKNIPVFLVARAIARRGTKAQPFMQEALEANESRINRLFDKAIEKTVNDIATDG